MIFGIAVRDMHGVLVARRDIGATEGKAGCVEVMEALRNAFLGTASQRQLAKQQITSIGMDGLERPAKLKAIEHLRSDPRTKQQIERFVGKKLGSERQGAAIPALSHRSYTTYAGGLSRSLFRLPEVVFDTPCKARSEARRNPLQRWVAIWIELRHA